MRRHLMALGLLVLVSCGSTAQVGGEGDPADGAGGAPGLVIDAPGDNSSGPASPAGTTDSTTGTSWTPAGAESADPRGTVPAGGGTSSTGGTPGGAALTTGRGFTAKQVFVGVGVQDDANQYGSTIGLDISVGDTRAQIAALVRDVNRRGGVLGRELVAVFHNSPTAESNANPNAEAQAACADWTEDHRVAAVLNSVAAINNETLFACLAKHDTPLFFSHNAGETRKVFDRMPAHLYAPGVMTVERMVPRLVERLAAQKYFSGWDTTFGQAGSAPVKVGLLYDESIPASKVYVDLVTAELRHRRITVASTFAVSGEVSTLGAEIGAAVLRFKQDGVTHVMPGNLFFAEAAEQQRYRPRYAITSYDAPGLLQTSVPAAQLAGALGVGYLPSVDVDNRHDPGDVSPAEARCRKVMQDAEQDTSNAITFFSMQVKCDLFWLFHAAANQAGSVHTPMLRSGLESLGEAFVSANTFRARLGPQRHDGASAVRALGFDSACACFTYRGALVRT